MGLSDLWDSTGGAVIDWGSGMLDKASGGNIQGYGGPQIDWSNYDNASRNDSQSRAGQQKMTGMLERGVAGNGPSVAQNQMQQGLQQTQQAAIAQAASARGGALSQSMASRNAMRAGVEAGQQTAAQASTLRAQEQMGYMQALQAQTNAQRQMDLQRQQNEASKALGIGGLQNQAAGVNMQGQTAGSQAAGNIMGGMMSGAGALLSFSDANAKQGIRPLVSDVKAKAKIEPKVIVVEQPSPQFTPHYSDEQIPTQWTPGPVVARAVPVISNAWHGRNLPAPYVYPSDFQEKTQQIPTTPPVEVAATKAISPAAWSAFTQSDANAKQNVQPLVSDVKAKTLFAPLDAPDPYAQNRSAVSQWQNAQATEAQPFSPGSAPKPDTSLQGAMRASYEGAIPAPYEYTAPIEDVVAPWKTTSLQDAMSEEAAKGGGRTSDEIWNNVKGRRPTDMTPIDDQPMPIDQVVAPWTQPTAQTAGTSPASNQGKTSTDSQKWGSALSAMGKTMVRSDAAAKTSVSDIRAKDNKEPGSPEIREFLGNLQPYGYEYKPGMGDGPGQRYGVMAQDLKKSDVGATMVERDPETGLLAIDVTKGFGPVLAAESDLHKRLSEIEKTLKAKRR